ncbi:MAG: M20/M25/M40 family metallo-hydrolase [Candidatus Marinimicrobia bacterium]|nr:M20/M25/M40 family metallo-hydrolase [Candidatus Neomarinimicrobiota bacterium]MBT3634582.1 M20/M25/M40 family metallo-hydrolase [Candidatus Neomarinimicrobiota bacterium]MBT3683337.1 M20/M25/M40 family metallo-hydrolase [Candidatus Neomarinimicrobiota bacterium]MBT3760236.1 M20/M25/M40 family metallo-hydrolase [Candidatus Neomarinimicrobiota bacterium]MBT3896331.1 M20/M25/M40 family metallo-hydrolase [Candidatus Neomarinimicrobiota bacterium]
MNNSIILKKSLLAALILFLGIFIVNTTISLLNAPGQLSVKPVSKYNLDKSALAENLARAIQFKTISYENKDSIDYQTFTDMHNFIRDTYPALFSNLNVSTINDYSLIFKWQGLDSLLDPVVLMAHQDVVPSGNSDDWTVPPFAGEIIDGFIWGRGALDDKGCMMSLIEATNFLVSTEFKPRRTLFLVLGHDEEIGGQDGALAISKSFESKNINPFLILDEGMAIVDGILPGVEKPVGLIGIAEKGYSTIELLATSKGGHSSMPPDDASINILTKGLQVIAENPLPADLDGVAKSMFSYLLPQLPLSTRIIFANQWLFNPLIISNLENQAETNALIRTTTAFTTFHSGIKENVLPVSAQATINFRLKPGDTIESVEHHVKTLIDDLPIQIIQSNAKFASNPSKISPIDSEGYLLLNKTIRQVFSKTIVAPGLVLGGTDSRHFENLTNSIYRFAPIVFTSEDLKRMHGLDERISIENYAMMVQFYIQLIKNTSN